MTCNYIKHILVKTLKNESVLVNIDSVDYIGESRKGSIIYFMSGNYLESITPFTSLVRDLSEKIIVDN